MPSPKPTGERWTIGYEYETRDLGSWEEPWRKIRMTLVSIDHDELAGWVKTWRIEVVESEDVSEAKP